MLTLMTLTICLFCMILTGWTLTTYLIKKDSQKFIIEELNNLFNICKQLFVSLKNLIRILASNSLSSESSEATPVEKNVLDEDDQPLSLVQTGNEIETGTLEGTNKEEDDDMAIASFSPEVVEVINEEEEKVA